MLAVASLIAVIRRSPARAIGCCFADRCWYTIIFGAAVSELFCDCRRGWGMVAVASLVAVGIQQSQARLCQRLYFADLGVAVPGASGSRISDGGAGGFGCAYL